MIHKKNGAKSRPWKTLCSFLFRLLDILKQAKRSEWGARGYLLGGSAGVAGRGGTGKLVGHWNCPIPFLW